ncbi:TonB-dependent receptor [Luteitalea pratensis]|uniref:TonB-dependent receptor n=1 Tax=Luteitalea pratensis TaxID=1855912 RepID=UPI001392457B|nr:TonB-dependent receptor [Luteitalea pratensis]
MRLRAVVCAARSRVSFVITATVLSLASTAAQAQDTTGVGAIRGVVLDAAGQPAGGVRVCALDTDSCATSDARGMFRIGELRAGGYRLEILPLAGLPFTSDQVNVRAGQDGAIEVTLPPVEDFQQTVTVTAPAFQAPEAVKNSGFLVEPRDLLKSAAALQDVSRYVQALPGVVIGTNDLRNDIIVRGGSPLENLFVVDNVEIPNINAFANFASAGGTVGLLDAQLLQDVTFLTGGYPAPYINRTSSVLQVTQREGNRREFGGWATLGFAGAGAILEGPINAGKGSWVVSARRSFLDLFTRDVGFGGVPVVYALNGKAVYDLTPRDRLWVVNIAGVDEIRLGLNESTDLDDEIANFDIRYAGWRSATGFNWQRTFGSRGVGLFGITHSEAKVGQQVKDLVAQGVPPPGVPPDDIIAESPVVYFEDSREGETTLKYDLTVRLPLFDTVQAGGSFKTFRIDYTVESPYGNDTPYSPVAGIDPFFLDTRFRSYQAGAYLQASKQVAARVNVTLGGRVDHYAVLSQVRFSPRAGVKVRLTDALSWNSSVGSYYQQPAFLFVSAFPQNASLVPWRADHYVTGLAWSPAADMRVTAEAYRKNYADYPVASGLPSVSLANIGDTFDVREILFPLTSAGEGRSEGVELFAEKRLTSKLYGQGNLSLSRTRHAGLDGVRRPGSFDYPFVFNLLGGYRLSPVWEVSARLSFLSGRPFTPYDQAVSTAQRRGVYDLTRVNAERAPDYARVDLRVDRTFTIGGQPLNLFLGVQNVINRRNFASYSWNRRTNAQQFGEQQGIFPIIGFDWRF